MPGWNILRLKKSPQQQVTSGRFEIERDGQIAFLDYTLAGNVLALIHTEVPENLRGHGLASRLAETAFAYAREHSLKVDIVCPSVQAYLARHPESRDLVLR